MVFPLLSWFDVRIQYQITAKTKSQNIEPHPHHPQHTQSRQGGLSSISILWSVDSVFLVAKDTPMPMAIWWAGSASCATAALTSTPRLQLIHGPRAPTGASLTCALEALVEHWLFSIGSYWFIGLLLIHDELWMSCLMCKVLKWLLHGCTCTTWNNAGTLDNVELPSWQPRAVWKCLPTTSTLMLTCAPSSTRTTPSAFDTLWHMDDRVYLAHRCSQRLMLASSLEQGS